MQSNLFNFINVINSKYEAIAVGPYLNDEIWNGEIIFILLFIFASN